LQRGAEERSGHGGQADDSRVHPADLAEEAEGDHPEGGRDADGGERRSGRFDGAEGCQEHEQRDDDDPAADAEEGAEEACGKADARVHRPGAERPRHGRILLPMTAELLAPLREAPERGAILLDVDGTLAPIVARPEDAAVPERTRRELERLAERYGLVACLSGRAGADAERVVGVEGIRYVGNHGLELLDGAEALASRIAAFRDAVGRTVEDKGLSLAYHFREAQDEAEARAALEPVATQAEKEGLVARWGRKVLEIRPSVEADKGTAVRTLIREAGVTRALYAGDDTTDLDAFAGLVAAGIEHFVRVAVVSDEGPRELFESADLCVEGPEELAELLASL
jgi:trehalose 6-phosphate phosphatase